ncbi:cadherin domain-containing protein [Anatilimnocola floriformis]|uniref:cadherin domain-containing protein n=1 Tax=Anatilimnocola floriformis TaxID=2948575 RepID=UPI0020C4E233|nr:cadherin domain-containing protein [Anatilimnocola floriformis]
MSAQLTSVNDLTLVTSAQLTSSQGILMALNKSLVVNAGGTISLPSSTSDLIASGTGSISLTTTRNISLGLFASITTASGDLSLSANQQVAPSTGSFVGIEIIGGTINVGNGNLSIKGRGGDNSSNNYGVFVRGSQGQVMSTGGAILVEGRAGGSGGGNSNFGVYLLSGAGISSAGSMSTATVTVKGYGGNFNGNGGSNNGVVVEQSDAFIRSNGGALLVEGTGGGGGGSGNNYGVHAMGGVIESTAAAVTVKGYGGNLSGAVGSDNYGVLVRGSSGLISAFSSVVVQGTGGGTGNSFNNFGVYLLSGGTITSTGTVASSTVAVSGNGGNSTGAGNTNFGVFIENSAATVSSSGGAIEITGISGSGATSPAISLQNTGRILGTSANAMVTLVGDSMDFLPSTSINAGSNFVTLKPRTAGTLINLGGDDGLIGSPLVLGLTDAAIDRVTAGTLQIGVPSSGTINVTSAISYEGNLTLVTGGGLSGSAGLTTGSATATTLRVQQTGNSTYTGVLGGNTTNANNFRLIKEGAGSLILTAAHTYAGNTLVNAGELRINGSLADTSETLAQTGGTVGGTGVLNNLLNASSLSTISPGNGMIGTLTVNHSALSGLQMGSPSQLNIELGGIASYDKLIVNGTISLSAGATLNLSSFNGYAPAPNSTFVFVVNDSSDPIVGTFVAGAGSSLVPGTVLTEGTLVSSNFLGSGLPAYITYLGGDGNDAAITLAGGQIEITSGATASIPENSVAAAYTIHAEFLGPGGTIAYGISGVDAARFQVNGSSGAITFVAPPNFENPVDSGFNNTYDIVVVASAGQLTATKPVVITVTDVNESPMIAAQTFSIPESVSIVVNGTFEYPHTNPANGLPFGWQRTGSVEVIGEDSTSGAGPAFDGEQFVDLNGEGTGGVSQVLATVPGHSYSLTFSYANNYAWTSPSNPATALVSIRSNSTDLVPAFSISHGSSNSLGLNWTLHAVNFTATSSSTTLQFLSTIPFGDGGIYIDGVSVVDQTMGTVNGSVVGTVSSSDVDISDTKTFAITGGNSSNAFAIHPTTGLLTVTNGSLLNFEERPTYVLMVSVTDAGGLTAINNMTINVTNLNEAPIVASQSFSIAENSPNGTLAGTVLAFDMDQADSKTFTITAGNLTGAFAINANTGAIRVADSVLLDYESVSSFALTVQVTDNGSPALSSTATVTINVTDRSEGRVFIPTTLTANAGGTLVVPVNLNVTEVDGAAVSSAVISLAYDSSKFTFNSINLAGGPLAGFSLDTSSSTPGNLVFTATGTAGALITSGTTVTLANVTFNVAAGAAAGASELNLRAATNISDATPNLFLLGPAITDGSTDANVDGSVAISAGPLAIASIVPTATGFVVTFNRPVNPANLNLYQQTGAGGILGAADVTLVGTTTGAVRGSVVFNSTNTAFTFIKTGMLTTETGVAQAAGRVPGILAPDTYTVTLRSNAADGFVDLAGNALRDFAGATAGDYTTTFNVATPATGTVTISVPDFARGYGQAVRVPNTAATGLPVVISDGTNVASVSFRLNFDPTLLSVTSFVVNPAIVGASATFTAVSPGVVQVTMSSASAFAATADALSLGEFVSAVPDTATYAAKDLLTFTNVQIGSVSSGPLPTLIDNGLHISSFLGDVNGSQSYNAADTGLIQRAILGINSGFAAYQLADPYIVGDINHSLSFAAADTGFVQRQILNIVVPNIPALPVGVTPPVGTPGPDPKLFIPNNLSGSVDADGNSANGIQVDIPVMLEVTEPSGITMNGFDLTFSYDPTKLTIPGSAGAPTSLSFGSFLAGAGFSGAYTIPSPGLVQVTASSGGASPQYAFGTVGALFTIRATVVAGATGTTKLNLRSGASVVDTDFIDLTLIPAPTNADTDSVDGAVVFAAPVNNPPVFVGSPYTFSLITGTDGDDRIIVGQLRDGRFRVRLGRQHLGDFVAAGVAIDSLRGEDFVYASPFASAVVVTGELTESDHVFGGENTQIVNSQTPEVSQQGASSGTLNDSALLQLISNWSNEFSDINPNGHSSRTGLSRRR